MPFSSAVISLSRRRGAQRAPASQAQAEKSLLTGEVCSDKLFLQKGFFEQTNQEGEPMEEYKL